MRHLKTLAILTLSLSFLSACTEAQYASHVIKQIPMPGDQPKSAGYYKTGSSYKIKGKRYHPKEQFRFSETGVASWYGPNFHGKMTANGETFDKNELTAAHRTLQMPSIIRVTNLKNGRSLVLRVNDRGPFAHDRVLDVSERASELLGFKKYGTTKVRIDVLEGPSREVAAMAKQRIDTTGYEIALNQNKTFTRSTPRYASNGEGRTIAKPIKVASSRQVQVVPTTRDLNTISPAAQPRVVPPASKPRYEPITTVKLDAPSAPAPKPAQHESMQIAGLSNAGINTPAPLAKPSNFFVQAGSFREEQNALNFSKQISSYGNSRVYFTRPNDTPTFRVKLGPYASNEEAARALSALQASGKSGIVIAE